MRSNSSSSRWTALKAGCMRRFDLDGKAAGRLGHSTLTPRRNGEHEHEDEGRHI